MNAPEKHLGFTGTRNGLTTEQMTSLHREFGSHAGPGTYLHHGDCVGADADAHHIARRHDLTIHAHPPHLTTRRAFTIADREWPPMPYLERNRAIVDACTLLYVGPGGPEQVHSGTWATVRYARKRGRHIIIIWPDGHLTEENL